MLIFFESYKSYYITVMCLFHNISLSAVNFVGTVCLSDNCMFSTALLLLFEKKQALGFFTCLFNLFFSFDTSFFHFILAQAPGCFHFLCVWPSIYTMPMTCFCSVWSQNGCSGTPFVQGNFGPTKIILSQHV